MDGRAGAGSRLARWATHIETGKLGRSVLSQPATIHPMVEHGARYLRQDPQGHAVLVVLTGENRRKNPPPKETPAAAGSSRALTEPNKDGLGG